MAKSIVLSPMSFHLEDIFGGSLQKTITVSRKIWRATYFFHFSLNWLLQGHSRNTKQNSNPYDRTMVFFFYEKTSLPKNPLFCQQVIFFLCSFQIQMCTHNYQNCKKNPQKTRFTPDIQRREGKKTHISNATLEKCSVW